MKNMFSLLEVSKCFDIIETIASEAQLLFA
jgi:hypothetical protein